jgi:hypothetical protein
MSGVQIGGLAWNNVGNNLNGVQVGGLVNVAGNLSGVQIGLVNYATKVDRGVQFGLWNQIKENGWAPILPIVNGSF